MPARRTRGKRKRRKRLAAGSSLFRGGKDAPRRTRGRGRARPRGGLFGLFRGGKDAREEDKRKEEEAKEAAAAGSSGGRGCSRRVIPPSVDRWFLRRIVNSSAFRRESQTALRFHPLRPLVPEKLPRRLPLPEVPHVDSL